MYTEIARTKKKFLFPSNRMDKDLYIQFAMDYIKTWNAYKEISSAPYWGIWSNLDAGEFRINPCFEVSADFH